MVEYTPHDGDNTMFACEENGKEQPQGSRGVANVVGHANVC